MLVCENGLHSISILEQTTFNTPNLDLVDKYHWRRYNHGDDPDNEKDDLDPQSGEEHSSLHRAVDGVAAIEADDQ